MALAYPEINGNRYEFASIEAALTPLPLGGGPPQAPLLAVAIKSVAYKSALEPAKVYGTQRKPIGRTAGQFKPEASMTLYKEEAEAFIAALGPGFMTQPFLLTVHYSETVTDPIHTDTIVGCRISRMDDSHDEGTGALVTKFDLDVMDILYDGVSPVL